MFNTELSQYQSVPSILKIDPQGCSMNLCSTENPQELNWKPHIRRSLQCFRLGRKDLSVPGKNFWWPENFHWGYHNCAIFSLQGSSLSHFAKLQYCIDTLTSCKTTMRSNRPHTGHVPYNISQNPLRWPFSGSVWQVNRGPPADIWEQFPFVSLIRYPNFGWTLWQRFPWSWNLPGLEILSI